MTSSKAKNPKREARDRYIRSRIRQQLAALPLPVSNAIKIKVEDGFVELEGYVRTFRVKERLHNFIMGLRGVRALKDLINVEPEESLEDRQIAFLVRQVLDAHSELPPGTATVHVHDGVCTLEGNVNTAEERHIAEVITKHCRGVKEVRNLIQVDPLDEVSDAATCRAVKGALAYCKDFETDGITVSCADGIVILRGSVPSIMDRTLAEEVTRMQFGVKGVENRIQVATMTMLEPVNRKRGMTAKVVRTPTTIVSSSKRRKA